jgi:hypothetical protein
MIDAGGQNNKVILLHPDTHPVIVLISYVKEAFTIKNISYLLILVQVFVEERLYLLFIDITHSLWRNYNFVTVLIAAFRRKCVDLAKRRAVVVEHPEF